jgi:hypothetical protein
MAWVVLDARKSEEPNAASDCRHLPNGLFARSLKGCYGQNDAITPRKV